MIRSYRFSASVLVILLALIAVLIPSKIASAQGGGPTDDEVNAIAKDLYCPVCENIPLDACGTQACVQWRSLIRERLEQGWTEEEIKTYFVNQYGDRVLAVPPPSRGINWLVYTLPPVAFLAGAIVLFQTVRNWRKSPAVEPANEDLLSEIDDPYAAQLEQELAARRHQGQRAIGDTQKGNENG